jgi:hypothetical protein
MGMSVELRIVVPEKVAQMLKICEQKTGIRMEDLIVASIIRLLEQYGVKPS